MRDFDKVYVERRLLSNFGAWYGCVSTTRDGMKKGRELLHKTVIGGGHVV